MSTEVRDLIDTYVTANPGATGLEIIEEDLASKSKIKHWLYNMTQPFTELAYSQGTAVTDTILNAVEDENANSKRCGVVVTGTLPTAKSVQKVEFLLRKVGTPSLASALAYIRVRLPDETIIREVSFDPDTLNASNTLTEFDLLSHLFLQLGYKISIEHDGDDTNHIVVMRHDSQGVSGFTFFTYTYNDDPEIEDWEYITNVGKSVGGSFDSDPVPAILTSSESDPKDWAIAEYTS